MSDRPTINEAANGQSELTDGLELRIARALAYNYFLGMADAKGASEETAHEYAVKRSARSNGWLKDAQALLCPY